MNKQIFYKIIYVVCLLIFIISIVYILGYLYFMYRDENEIEEIQKIIKETSIDENIENKLNTENEINNANQTINENINNFKKIKSKNSNIIAWIKIEGTKIDYPVMQARDNDYYLNKNYKNKYSRNGSIFVDCKYDFSKENQNMLIYGHNNRDGMMFNDLLNYEKEEFFNKHLNIKLITENEEKIYSIIAVFKSKVYNVNDKNVFRYYNYIDLSNEDVFDEYIKKCKEKSIYNIEKNPVYGDDILTLSTCEYSTKNGRFVVVATN